MLQKSSLVPALTAGLLAVAAAPAWARTITVDGDMSDWDEAGWAMDPPSADNLGHIARSPGEEGEYIWRDAPGDERTDFASPDSRVDLTQFRVTGDSTYLYILARFVDINQLTGDGAPQLRVAIDTNRLPSTDADAGRRYLVDGDTMVAANAYWERLLITKLASGKVGWRMLSPDPSAPPDGVIYNSTTIGDVVASDVNEVIEGRVAWTDLGLTGPPTTPLRFTVGVVRSNIYDDQWQVDGRSDCLDVLTNYGNPGSVNNTWAEVSDGDIDYTWDVSFEAHVGSDNGDPYAPLLISEFIYDVLGTEPAAEFIEILDVSPALVNVANYKVGDEEQIDSGEGMWLIPCGALAVGDTAVLANSATVFLGRYGFLPDYTPTPASYPVKNTTGYSTWATGSVNLTNGGDEVLLLDPFDTILDTAAWANSTTAPPALTGISITAAEDRSLSRTIAAPTHLDRNDMLADFTVVLAGGTPEVSDVDCACGAPQTDDADSDGVPNCRDICWGAPDIDTDGDGLLNCLDPDDDNDGILDGADLDDDNDGVPDTTDPNNGNPAVCGDSDFDTCDDCAVGTDGIGPLSDSLPADDGTDTDGDGLCDAGDPDDDNDGSPDVSDVADGDPRVCGDSDADTCDECSQNPTGGTSPKPWPEYVPSAANDGPDTDGDGACNAGDTDDDNDGALDSSDTDDANPQICTDADGDTCNDCALNPTGGTSAKPWPLYTPDTANDGTDTDGDGLCNAGDADDDNDGVLDSSDTDDADPQICSDVDGDNCNECSLNPTGGTSPKPWPLYSPSKTNDGTDTDGDGFCNVGDGDDDNDGVTDPGDDDPMDPRVCHDTDTDLCDECSQNPTSSSSLTPWPLYTPSVANDGTDTDGDGACDAGDTDNDNDGVTDGLDVAPEDPRKCDDKDADTCDECSQNPTSWASPNSPPWPLYAPSPSNDGTDTDADGACDNGDTDDDNDGVLDTSDPDGTKPTLCGDSDYDSCDDCSQNPEGPGTEPWATYTPSAAHDGPDTDSDGLCDVGDTDDDNDGVLDTDDPVDSLPDICGDDDNDGCDDCAVGVDGFGPLADSDPMNDGTDTDGDGLCNLGDPDDDNDGAADGPDSADLDPRHCADVDGDGCDDCSQNPAAAGSEPWEPYTPNSTNDGADFDADGTCDAGDPDDDGDGTADTADCAPFDATVHPGALEVCDGIDNDCDAGTIDGSGDPLLGALCDGLDSDLCNEGAFSCVTGGLVCSDASDNNLDVCDGVDNDCDGGSADGSEDPLLATTCDGPDSDLCKEGTYTGCNLGALVCSDVSGDTLDVCDGADNDCDPASADGSEDATLGVTCDGPDSDLCAEGVTVCQGGSPTCNDATGDDVEMCDGADNDCDGSTDEEFAVGLACDGDDLDLCQEGITVCNGGQDDVVCNDVTGDNVLVCDNVDDDCDGSLVDGFADLDLDGIPDCVDTDRDGDGTPDASDGCPDDAAKPAVGACGCGTPDADSDADGVADCIDDCPAVANADQADQDGDGVGDACDEAVPPTPAAPDEGCSCSSATSGDAPAWAAVLLALACIRRRRR